MYKSYKLKAIITCAALTMGAQLSAQRMPQKDAVAVDSGRVKTVPNRFFNDDPAYSTAAISTAGSTTLYKTPSPAISNSLFGVLPGLTVQQQSGEPGFEDSNLNIRGIGSYGYTNGSGYNTQIIFVDGFEVSPEYFHFLSASEIANVSVLKDAAALATFGMKGANGVIWVNTKRGNTGKSTVTFQARTGTQSAININKPLNSFGYASLYNQARSNDNGRVWTPTYTEDQLTAYQNGTGTNVDWFAETIQDNSPYTDASLIFSGGDSQSLYNIVFDYANKQGQYNVDNSDATSNQMFGRYNLRANLDFDLGKIFEAKVDLSGRLEDRKSPNYTTDYSTGRFWNDLYTYPSNIYPVSDDADGVNYSGTAQYPNNPVASLNALGWQSTRRRFLQGNFGLKEKLDFITKGLYLNQTMSFNSFDLSSYSKTTTYARYINGATTTTDIAGNLRATDLRGVAQEDWRQFTAGVGYDTEFGENAIKSVLNYHQSQYNGEGLFGYKVHYQNISGRLNYGFKQRYIAELGFSYFGSDAYAEGNRFHFYPALSAAWVVSNESFLSDSKIFDFFKLRGSVGKSATEQSIGPGRYGSGGRYLYQQFYGNSGNFYTGNGAPANQGGLTPLFIANPNVGPEESMKYNLGADLKLFNALNFTADVYMDKRTGILTLDNGIPSIFGDYTYLDNIGEMTNKGLELSTSYAGKAKSVGYNFHAMTSFNKNNIDFQSEVLPAFSYNARTGRPFGTQIGLVADGFYQLEDFNANGTLKAGIPAPLFGAIQPGDIKYLDLDNNGTVDATDVTEIGKSAMPTMNYSFGGGLDFKGFDISVFFQGARGSSVNLLGNNILRAQNVPFVNNGNAYEIAQGAWAYYPAEGIDTRATATYPRLTTNANDNNYINSSFWIKSGNYLRIRNAELGYNFSNTVLSKMHLSKLRAFVNAVNPVTWSSVMKEYNIDPEFNNGYPTIKSYNVGVTATF